MQDLSVHVVHLLLAADEFSLIRLRIDLTGVPLLQKSTVIHMDDILEPSWRRMQTQFETVKIIFVKCRNQHTVEVIVVVHSLQLFDSTADREGIHEHSALIDRALGHATEFPKFRVAEVLHAEPDSNAQNHKNNSDSTTARPEQEKAQQSENCGNGIEDNHHLTLREAAVCWLVGQFPSSN
jgi:hypothetical protein